MSTPDRPVVTLDELLATVPSLPPAPAPRPLVEERPPARARHRSPLAPDGVARRRPPRAPRYGRDDA